MMSMVPHIRPARRAAAVRPARAAAAVLLAAGLVLASAPPVSAQEVRDPLEGLNRKIFAFNDAADRWVLRPVAKGYDQVTPDPVQQRIGNFFTNLETPFVALNQFLQGKPKAGARDFGRFFVNTTVGIGGFFDVAAANGLPRHNEDFGQTFARWAGGQGIFLMIPLRGPATTTHAAGMAVGAYTSPLRLLSSREAQIAVGALEVIDLRADLLSADEMISGDRYLFIRDAYLQSREYEINDGAIEDDPFLDEDF